ncbi:MAG: hypothetical protein ACOCYE_06190 [Pseudomonadota bacterium]
MTTFPQVGLQADAFGWYRLDQLDNADLLGLLRAIDEVSLLFRRGNHPTSEAAEQTVFAAATLALDLAKGEPEDAGDRRRQAAASRLRIALESLFRTAVLFDLETEVIDGRTVRLITFGADDAGHRAGTYAMTDAEAGR